uniref:SFRICE_028976 n=1 Tax=Spodoptera frugiperda TaxID=7108 RepID=A0A2H1WT74_SPOFR
MKLLNEIKVKSTEDLWGLSVKSSQSQSNQSTIETTAQDLALSFNKSIDDGLFPDLMKCSKVHVNGTNSQGSEMKMGVSQGSILGPFLFMVYMNDLPFVFENQPRMVLFANDISLIFRVNQRSSNFNNVNRSICLVQNWFTINNLALNEKKTKCIKFSLSKVHNNDCDVVLNGQKLEFINETVFLGITLDTRLQWRPHIKALSERLSSVAFEVTDEKTARLHYFSDFHNIMSHDILLWGRAAEIKSIFILQKQAIRAIYKLSHRKSLRKFFKTIDILTMPCQFIYENIMYVRKKLQLFEQRSDGNNFNTSDKNKLVRLSKVQKSFMGLGVQCYNKIPTNILDFKESDFETCIKHGLCKKAYYKVTDYLKDENAWQYVCPAPPDNTQT